MSELSKYIETELLDLGASPDYVGYRCLVIAIRKAIEDDSILNSITTRLYPEIAAEIGGSAVGVERAMRTVIAQIFDSCGMDKMKNVLGRAYDQPLANSKFVGVMSRRLMLKYQFENMKE